MYQWEKLYTYIESLLKEQLKPHLRYHNWDHTLYVMDVCERLCAKISIDGHELLLIKTAALLHDTGFIIKWQGHEEESIVLAKKVLPDYGYTAHDIALISGMIRATIIPQRPFTMLENILADADLYYLGTDDFEQIGNRLYLELKHYTPTLSVEEWNQIQIKFLQTHHYHTAYCIAALSEKKQAHLAKLLSAS